MPYVDSCQRCRRKRPTLKCSSSPAPSSALGEQAGSLFLLSPGRADVDVPSSRPDLAGRWPRMRERSLLQDRATFSQDRLEFELKQLRERDFSRDGWVVSLQQGYLKHLWACREGLQTLMLLFYLLSNVYKHTVSSDTPFCLMAATYEVRESPFYRQRN